MQKHRKTRKAKDPARVAAAKRAWITIRAKSGAKTTRPEAKPHTPVTN
jgi:hypothetical protein